jgi:hypothetical protein
MSKAVRTYREMLAHELSRKPNGHAAGVLVVSDLQFTPSRAAVQKADEVRRRLRAKLPEPVSR